MADEEEMTVTITVSVDCARKVYKEMTYAAWNAIYTEGVEAEQPYRQMQAALGQALRDEGLTP